MNQSGYIACAALGSPLWGRGGPKVSGKSHYPGPRRPSGEGGGVGGAGSLGSLNRDWARAKDVISHRGGGGGGGGNEK